MLTNTQQNTNDDIISLSDEQMEVAQGGNPYWWAGAKHAAVACLIHYLVMGEKPGGEKKKPTTLPGAA